MYKPLSIRGAVELAIVNKIIEQSDKKGYSIVAYDSVYQDGSEPVSNKTLDREEFIEYVFGGDDAFIRIMNGVEQEGWINLIYGNDGWDVVSDYSVSLEDFLKPVADFSDKIEAGEFKIVA